MRRPPQPDVERGGVKAQCPHLDRDLEIGGGLRRDRAQDRQDVHEPVGTWNAGTRTGGKSLAGLVAVSLPDADQGRDAAVRLQRASDLAGTQGRHVRRGQDSVGQQRTGLHERVDRVAGRDDVDLPVLERGGDHPGRRHIRVDDEQQESRADGARRG